MTRKLAVNDNVGEEVGFRHALNGKVLDVLGRFLCIETGLFGVYAYEDLCNMTMANSGLGN